MFVRHQYRIDVSDLQAGRGRRAIISRTGNPQSIGRTVSFEATAALPLLPEPSEGESTLSNVALQKNE